MAAVPRTDRPLRSAFEVIDAEMGVAAIGFRRGPGARRQSSGDAAGFALIHYGASGYSTDECRIERHSGSSSMAPS